MHIFVLDNAAWKSVGTQDMASRSRCPGRTWNQHVSDDDLMSSLSMKGIPWLINGVPQNESDGGGGGDDDDDD